MNIHENINFKSHFEPVTDKPRRFRAARLLRRLGRIARGSVREFELDGPACSWARLGQASKKELFNMKF